MVLHTLRRLEAHIDSAFLGPLLPETEEQRRLWTDPPIDFDRIPLVDRWTPPAFLPAFREEGFVLLGSNTVCFQRGYGPGEEMMNQYGRIISTCFQYRTPTECTSFVARSTYDFLVLVMAGPNQVAAGCTVEFHACAHQIPYLFVGDLCTDLPFRGNGYAHQLVHAVHTLGSLLAATAQTNAWKHAVPSDRPLYIGLTVDRKSSVADRLVRLYRECGLSTRDETPSLPIIDYGTFTPYSCFGWHVERRPEQEIGMWKCITPYTWNFLMNPKEYEELGMTGKKYVNDISVHDLGNCIQLNIRVNYIKLDENSKHLDVDRRYYEFKFIKANPSSSRLDITAICKSSTSRFEVLDDPQEASKRND